MLESYWVPSLAAGLYDARMMLAAIAVLCLTVAGPEPTIPEAVTRAAALILEMQEGDAKDRWPYEGVYRVQGEIPVGYEVGGTAICATALLRAPGYDTDAVRQGAVARATKFVCGAIDHPLMSIDDYDAGYDVRGWGYTYGLAFLLELKARGGLGGMAVAVNAGAKGKEAAEAPPGPAPAPPDAIETAISFYLRGIHSTEIPGPGGWSYARPRGRDKVGPPSPFMTAPTLQALFEAKRQGYGVDEAVVARALDTLESARTPAGAVVYAGKSGENERDAIPGATGRMLAAETTLYLAGRSTPDRIRGSIDAFIVHWEWLDKRRAQQGTHAPPYAIAPYYFYFAHYHAAQAVEFLPEAERPEYRRRINALLFSVRQEDGSWNDRVFPRTASYGTSMAAMALMMPETPAPAEWVGSK
jgi:hypothetical protein